MQPSEKRTVQVNVKMSTEDLTLLQRAAATLWPGAVISNSGIVLGLARMAAADAVVRAKKPKK